MSVNIKVPSLGESVTEATIAKWHKKEGDSVQADELLVELETDKINMEINAETSGVLRSIKKDEGSVVKVGDVVGSIEEGEVTATKKDDDTKEEVTSENRENLDSATGSNQSALSPAVRKIVAEKSIDISQIQGTGKDGRIIKGDVLDKVPSNILGQQKEIAGNRDEERVKMSRLRQRIAERLKESQNTAAILTTFNEVDMSKIMAVRTKHQDNFIKKYNVKLGFMSFFVKAVIAALKDIPEINAEIDGIDIVYKNYYDIGVAVGTEKGLVVPVIKGADLLSFADIEKTIIELATKAKEGRLSMDDLTGGTFSITNGGIYGSMLSTPIINPPQSGILGMHNIVKRPVVVDDQIVVRPMMYIALSYDHRIVDGKEAVTFLVKVKEFLENPEIFGLMA